jgi:SNF2 family DNA or RNA helicase
MADEMGLGKTVLSLVERLTYSCNASHYFTLFFDNLLHLRSEPFRNVSLRARHL